ncbi:HNH endonuclease [Balneatrix alpica]|uniref:HNH endonuclease n=1 Tax=Balneatrix alpica TaxID=75684 RepID=UPI00273941CA|nr:HNH endonuclease [Balneatrix alpica]
MSAYLYTWNPDRWVWVDQADAVYRVSNGDQYDMYWSCGVRKNIEVGDVFFLMRLGVDPKGIIGCGYVSSKPYELPHWDEKKAEEGKTALRTDLLFKSLSDVPIISLTTLGQRYPDYNWTPQAGGQTIPETIADELFGELQRSVDFGFASESPAEVRLYAEGKVRTVTSRTYDRSPLARQACIQHYGYSCFACGFNFGWVYGPLGETYIEVHHLQQIADVGEEYLIDPVKDLRPVCANCHRMLHRRRPPLSIEELLAHNNSLQARRP